MIFRVPRPSIPNVLTLSSASLWMLARSLSPVLPAGSVKRDGSQ
jgi:hypothetical protein